MDNETARLQALQRYDVTSPSAEPGLVRLTRLSARLYAVPMAVIAFVDDSRSWFKARYGIDLEGVPREESLCGASIGTLTLLSVEDASKDPRFADLPLVRRDPHIRFYASAPIRTPDGYNIGTIAIADDKPRSVAEHELRFLEDIAGLIMDQLELRAGGARAQRDLSERFQLVSRATLDAVWDWDLITGTVWWNEGFRILFGYAQTEIEPGFESWTSRIHPDDRERVEKGILEVVQNGGKSWADDYRFRRKDGTFADIFDRGYVAHDDHRKPVRMIGMMTDVTERKRGDRAQSALYRIANATIDATTLEDLLRSIHDVVRELMPAKSFFIALYQGEENLDFAYFIDEQEERPLHQPSKMGRGLSAYVLRTGEPLLLTDEARFEDLVRSGEVERMGAPSVSWLGVPLKTKGETLGILVAQSYEPGVVHSQRDMELLQFVSTQVAHAIEHKRAEEALRERERRFRALIENSADGIALLSERGRILFRSPSVHRILGYGLDANLGEMLQHIDPADVEAAKGFWKAALAKPAAPVPLAIRIRSNDGSIRPIEGILVNRLDDPAMRGVVLNFRDVSERKQAEARLMAADRMVSVGTLAAGVAHEINNPLAYVLANLALVADALPEGNDAGVRDAIAAARDGAERVRQIVRDLKTFSRAEETVLGPVNVHEVLDASANLAWNEIRHRARLERSYREDLPLAHANAARLGQVVLNLLLNAAQAMPDIHGGRENVIALRSAEADGQITIEVADNGSGIAPEHLPRLFDPFFTTKPLGIGTGLGLYVCQQLLSSMGGTITVDSAPGRGSTFRVLLPAARSLAPAPQPPSQPQPRERPHGRARILAVDDEPQIGRVIVHTLKAHDVTAPPTAEEALRLVRAGERFDLIICDLMMPGMTGMDLFAALERDFPDQAARMLFLTGGAFTPRARDFLETVAAPRMEKPFEVKALRARVAELLETFDNQR